MDAGFISRLWISRSLGCLFFSSFNRREYLNLSIKRLLRTLYFLSKFLADISTSDRSVISALKTSILDSTEEICDFTSYLILKHSPRKHEMIIQLILTLAPTLQFVACFIFFTKLSYHLRLEYSYEIARNSFLAKMRYHTMYYCSKYGFRAVSLLKIEILVKT